ncbi:ABC transporter permease [Salinicoccus carnicancri]|uniref:ABC transporter permease n=1 Tax=Salinicoccus carnicancri TaxID=558170 RepID=UPI0002D59EB5|nr:ABC transporter permease [Salinicoccus carnicancri]
MNLFRMTYYLISISFKDFGFWFWTLCYPLLLTGLFIIATSNMTVGELENINVGIQENQELSEVIGDIDFINMTVMSEEEAVLEMKQGDISGYIHGDNTLLVTETGFDQTVLEMVINQIEKVAEAGIPYENYDFEAQFIEENSQEAQPEAVLFYSLIAMIAFYGIFSGIEFMSSMQPNLDPMGARFAASPYSKVKFLSASVLGALILNLATNFLILAVIIILYKINLFTELGPTLGLLFIANLTGIGLGLIIGLLPKINAGMKTTVSVIFIIGLAALSGLMGPFIKIILIENNLAWVNTLNPLARLTDTMYKINFLGNYDDYWATIGMLTGYAAVFFSITLLSLRRKQYDSI